jgi:hypothetical protein
VRACPKHKEGGRKRVSWRWGNFAFDSLVLAPFLCIS